MAFHLCADAASVGGGSAQLSARMLGKTLCLERRGCPANSTHAATLGNARKIAPQRRDAIVATGPRWRHGAAQTRRRARKTGFAHRGKDTAKPWAGDPRHGKLSFKTTALPRTGLRGFKGASVRDAKARGAKSDAKGKGAGRPHLTLRLRFYPPPGPKNQGVTRHTGPPAGEAGDRRGGRGWAHRWAAPPRGEAGRPHKRTGCTCGQFHRSPQHWAVTARRPPARSVGPHVSFGFAARAPGSPVGQTPPGQTYR